MTPLNNWLKLYSESGVYQGLVCVPDEVCATLEKKSSIHKVISLEPFFRQFSFDAASLPSMALDVVHFVLRRSYLFEEDGVELYGISPEDLYKAKGFAFVPAVGYASRKPEPEKAQEPKPTEPGKYLAAAREVT